MIAVRRQQQILGEKNSHAMSLADGDGWRNVEESVEDSERRLRQASSYAFAVSAGIGGGQSCNGAVVCANGRKSRNCSYRDRSPKDSEVVVVNFVV